MHLQMKIVWCGNKLTNKFLRTKTPEERDEIAKDLFNYFLKVDFNSYGTDFKKVGKDWENLKAHNLTITEKDGISYADNIASTGNKIYRTFFPNLMKLKNGNKKSVYECLTDPQTLWKIIRNRVGNTLIYAEKKGETPKQYPMTTTKNMMVQGSKASGLASHGSQFKPLLAKAIYNKFVKDGDNVLDYSAGYGARLMGLWATGKSAKYYAYEPCPETYAGLNKMKQHFGLFADIKKCGSEEELFDVKFDFVFSSPPYFDQETYTDDTNQAYNKFPKYEDFMEKYWRKTVQNIKLQLKPNAIFGINIGNSSNEKMIQIRKDFLEIIENEGFIMSEEWVMRTARSHLTNKRKTSNTIKEENIYFYKLGKQE